MNCGRKYLIPAAAVLLAVAFIPVFHHYQLRAEAEAYLAGLKAKGEPVDLAQVVPPPVPSDQNGAPLITNALAQIYSNSNYTNSIILNNAPYAMNQTTPGKEMIGWHQPVIHDPSGTWPPNLTNTWEDFGEQLAGRQNDLNDFRKLIKKAKLDFNYDYSNPKVYVRALMSHLPPIKVSVQWLFASEFYSLHQGKTADACTDVRAMLAFVKGQTDERFEISQLIRFALASTSANATWNILQTPNVSDAELEQLQRDWQSLEFVEPTRKAFLFERFAECQLQNSLRQSPSNLETQVQWTRLTADYHYKLAENGNYVLDDERSFFRKVMDEIFAGWKQFQWCRFWSYTDEIRGLRMWQTVIDGAGKLETNHSFQSVEMFLDTNFVLRGYDSVKTDPYAILSQNAAGQLIAIRRLARTESMRNIVITAIALKRHQLHYRNLPKTLDELIPAFLKAIPIDYMDGQPLRYRRNDDGTFLLYSVGENCKDDGGNPSYKPEQGVIYSSYDWQSPHARDWVWPQPATEAEIKYFYERPPK